MWVLHTVLGPKAGESAAQCMLSVRQTSMELDYANKRVRAFNEAKGWYLGTTRIRFTDRDRKRVSQVSWRDDGEANFADYSSLVDIDWPVSANPTDIDLVDFRAEEGRRKLVRHLLAERSPELARRKKDQIRKQGLKLKCEACRFDFANEYGTLGDACCEVHHKVSVSAGIRATALKDLAVLCSNCHRMIHKMQPISVEEFARYLKRLRKQQKRATTT